MDKKLILASVVIVGLTIFYFKVVKKKSVATSATATINPANLPSNLGQTAINKVSKAQPSSNENTASMKVVTAKVPANAVRNNTVGSTSMPCGQGFYYNTVFRNCVKQF